MVNQKQTDSPKTLAKNLTLCAESTKNISVLTNKPKRTRKSTSSIAELISSKVEPDQIPDENKAIDENSENIIKKVILKRAASIKENVDTTTPIPEDKPTVQAISKDESNETENFKLEQISVNTLGKTTDKRRRSAPTKINTSQTETTTKQQDTTTTTTKKAIKSNETSVKQVKKMTKKASTKKIVINEESSSSGSEDELVIEDASVVLEDLDLEYLKLTETDQSNLRPSACAACEMTGASVECKGTCKSMYHLECLGFNYEYQSVNYMCQECTTGIHCCFVCKKTTDKVAKKCNISKCGRYFHDTCAKEDRLFHEDKNKSINNISSYMCSAHTCLTCKNDEELGLIEQKVVHRGRMMNCVRCSNSYHTGDLCVPPGSLIIDSGNMVCAEHFEPDPKNKTHTHINVAWCFACCKSDGDLIGCSLCPAAYHKECRISRDTEANAKEKSDKDSKLKNDFDEKNWRCEDCIIAKRPLYGDIIWAKVGIYRWWPAEVCHPRNLPQNIRDKPAQVGEFYIRFFGTYDFYWVPFRRCFLFAKGDEFVKNAQKGKTLDVSYTDGVIDAIVAFREITRLKNERYSKLKGEKKQKRQEFSYLKSNKPVGKVKIFKLPLDELSQCACDPKSAKPCATTECLNVALKYECHSNLCAAGERCHNQRFVKRQYPRQETIQTNGRGCGLWALDDIKSGDFVNEYVGELIDHEESKRRLKWAYENDIADFYLMTIDKDRVIDAGPKGNLSRFMNHSCEPNCETQRWIVNGDVRIGLFAVKDIPAKTELTFNYRLDCLANEKAECKCGSKNCSGFLGARPKPMNSNFKEIDSSTSNSKKRKQNSRNSLDTIEMPLSKKTKKRSKTISMPLSVDSPDTESSSTISSSDNSSKPSKV